MASLPNNDADIYLVIEDFGERGPSFLETDLAQADRDTIVRNFISGQYQEPLRVISFNAAEGWSRDVSEDIAGEVIDRAYDADKRLTEGIKRFVDRHLDHQRRPQAPSVLREQVQASLKKA